MKLDVSVIKWREEINKKFSEEINKKLCEEINNRWNEFEYTWSVNTPTVDTTSTTTNYYTCDGGATGVFYWDPQYLTTLSSSPF